MSVSLGWLSRRLVLSLFAAYLVMSLAFGLVAFTPDPNEGALAYSVARETGGNATAVEAALEDYREARDRDVPIEERYAGYLLDTVQLEWGASHSQGRTVSAVIGESLPVTARYVLLALLLSTLGGLALGAYGALGHGSLGDRSVSVVVYGLFGMANFYLVAVPPFEAFVGPPPEWLAPHLAGIPEWLGGPGILATVVGPGVLLSTTLLAGQLRYARAASLEYLDREFVKLLRSKGAGPLRIVRHVVRNASIPLVSLFFSELLAVLVLEMFVIERVFGLGGIASVTLRAVNQRDLPLIVGVAMTVAILGIAANLLQDVAYRVLDPRVDDTEG